jgi:hypothetical protein
MSPAPFASDENATFASLLDRVRKHVDGSLAVWLKPRVAAASAVSAEVGAAAEAVEGLAVRGGKRMRAALVGAAFVACGDDASDADGPSCARRPRDDRHRAAAGLPTHPRRLDG